MKPWKVLVIYRDGRGEYVKKGASDQEDATFTTRRDAERVRDLCAAEGGPDVVSVTAVRE